MESPVAGRNTKLDQSGLLNGGPREILLHQFVEAHPPSQWLVHEPCVSFPASSGPCLVTKVHQYSLAHIQIGSQ